MDRQIDRQNVIETDLHDPATGTGTGEHEELTHLDHSKQL